MALSTSHSPTDEHVLEAIRLRCSQCFQAMNFANALGGSPSVPWELVRTYSLSELVADALDRGLVDELRTLKAAVDHTPFMDTPHYLKVREMIGGRVDFPQ